MTDLTLLHSARAHIATFEHLRERIAPEARLAHIVREDLLARACAEGVSGAIAAELAALIAEADGPVLCTCTTLGEAAEAAGAHRIDRAAMRRAAQAGGPVMLAYCLESTEKSSHALLEEEMARAGNTARIAPLFLQGAWRFFEAGEPEAFARAIASGIRAAHRPGTAAILLAQASMAGAAPLLADLPAPVIASPEPALRAALGLSADDRTAPRE